MDPWYAVATLLALTLVVILIAWAMGASSSSSAVPMTAKIATTSSSSTAQPPSTAGPKGTVKTTKTRTTTQAMTQATGTWYPGFLTAYSSYPEKGSAEWTDFNGGAYLGMFAYGDRKYSEEEVKSMNIVSFTLGGQGGAGPYKKKTIRIRDPETGKQIDAQALDYCGNDDCNGCCDRNAAQAPSSAFPKGVLLDLEYYTANRFWGKTHRKDLSDFTNKKVEWQCIDC